MHCANRNQIELPFIEFLDRGFCLLVVRFQDPNEMD